MPVKPYPLRNKNVDDILRKIQGVSRIENIYGLSVRFWYKGKPGIITDRWFSVFKDKKRENHLFCVRIDSLDLDENVIEKILNSDLNGNYEFINGRLEKKTTASASTRKFRFSDGSIITASCAEEAKAKHKVIAANNSFPFKIYIHGLSPETTKKAKKELANLIKNEYELDWAGSYYAFRNAKDLDKAKKFFDAKKWKYSVEDYSTEVFSDVERKELKSKGFKKDSDFSYGERWLKAKFCNIKGLWAYVAKIKGGFTTFVEWDNDYNDCVPRALRYFNFGWNYYNAHKEYSSFKECFSMLDKYTAIVNKALTEAKESEKRIDEIERELQSLK